MNKKKIFEIIFFSISISTIGTLINIFHFFIGGNLAGGIYSENHTIIETLKNFPLFIARFLVYFIISFVFFSIINKKK